MPEYTIAALVATAVVVVLELKVFRTGVFRSRAYWITLGICLFFMILVNGWLTKLSAPIVLYNADMKTPWRVPFDIPVEDYFFGFPLLTLALILWIRQGRDDPDEQAVTARAEGRAEVTSTRVDAAGRT
ncbi:MAG: lycopene cyclase domain-containing protein [Acidimicrobiales bacterium]